MADGVSVEATGVLLRKRILGELLLLGFAAVNAGRGVRPFCLRSILALWVPI